MKHSPPATKLTCGKQAGSLRDTFFLELPQRNVEVQAGEVELVDEAMQDCQVEGPLQVAEVLADHLAAQALAAKKKLCRGERGVVEKVLL